MPVSPTVVWFRDDLRVSDQPALRDAVDADAPVVCLYVFDESGHGSRPLGAASRWWLHHSLTALDASLRKRGARLAIREGAAEEEVRAVLRQTGAERLTLGRRYARGERAQDDRITHDAEQAGVEVRTFTSNLLHEPGDVLTGDGERYGVFTPFWRALTAAGTPREPLPTPSRIDGWSGTVHSESVVDLRLLPRHPDWSGGLGDEWTPGEKAAHRRLDEFLAHRLRGYPDGRDRPAQEATSRLSPHLKFGEISPYQLWHRSQQADVSGPTRDKFLAEVGWREFDYDLLERQPHLDTVNVHRQFDRFPWARANPSAIAAWQQGRTGIPLVDAGMRQLWQTGWMHNRVRMVVASFLVKNLRIDWRHGEQWFWDTLVDADPANNPAQWQWVAGSGADAAPYFRIFNPVTQSKKFDPQGEYIARWVPELRSASTAARHEPWTAPDETGDYPEPIVDLKQSRAEALTAYEQMRS